jgi:hypothetical protein
LTNPAFLDKEIAENGSLEKAKPFVRRGRKAAGPAKDGVAVLPKVEPLVSLAFFVLMQSHRAWGGG